MHAEYATDIKHTIVKTSIKMYDKYKIILRLGKTFNDLTFLNHCRMIKQRDVTIVAIMANIKSIYCLAPMQIHLKASNCLYLENISAFQTHETG